jgi:microcystin-dependent protein
MATPFVGTIIIFGGNFAPLGWAFCNGQTVAISQYAALFNLIGTMYGGNGTTTFNLPDLRSRVPIHQGQGTGLSNYVIGSMAGSESITLTTAQAPQHTHLVSTVSGTPGNQPSPSNTYFMADEGGTSAEGPANAYVAGGSGTQQAMASASIGSAGGSQPHNNIQPVLAVNYVIALQGIYPTQS